MIDKIQKRVPKNSDDLNDDINIVASWEMFVIIFLKWIVLLEIL